MSVIMLMDSISHPIVTFEFVELFQLDVNQKEY